MLGYNTAATLIFDSVFETFNMTCFLLPNKTLNLRFHWDYTQPCMIIFSTIWSIVVSFSHICILILRLQHSSFIDTCLTFREFQHDMPPPPQQNPQFEIPLRLESTLYDHLQHCTFNVYIFFSYQYTHCEATTQQLHWYYLPYFLSISIWHASSTPINPSVLDYT